MAGVDCTLCRQPAASRWQSQRQVHVWQWQWHIRHTTKFHFICRFYSAIPSRLQYYNTTDTSLHFDSSTSDFSVRYRGRYRRCFRCINPRFSYLLTAYLVDCRFTVYKNYDKSVWLLCGKTNLHWRLFAKVFIGRTFQHWSKNAILYTQSVFNAPVMADTVRIS